MTPPKLVLILSENWTMTSPRDLRSLVRFAVQAEDAGIDAMMMSEHIVLGVGRGRRRPSREPAGLRLAGQPGSRHALAELARAAVRDRGRDPRLRLVAGAVIPPLRHPLLLAKDLATLDLLSEGRLVVQPTVSWHRAEYEALGVPFGSRGALLDEHLAAWDVLWRDSPASFDGTHYRFHDVFLEPKPFRTDGPRLWFGGSSLHDRLIRRIVRYGHGFNPLGRPAPDAIWRVCARHGRGGPQSRRARDGGRDARCLP